MNINLQVVYNLKEDGGTLCFRHATLAALAGNDIETTVDDFGGEGDMRSTYCHLCLSDNFNEAFNKPEVYPDYDYDEPDEEEVQDPFVESVRLMSTINNKPIKEEDLATKGFHIKSKKGRK